MATTWHPMAWHGIYITKHRLPLPLRKKLPRKLVSRLELEELTGRETYLKPETNKFVRSHDHDVIGSVITVKVVSNNVMGVEWRREENKRNGSGSGSGLVEGLNWKTSQTSRKGSGSGVK